MGRPNGAVAVSVTEGEQLRTIARSRSLPHSLVRRTRIVLMSAEGVLIRRLRRVAASAFRLLATGGDAGANAALPGRMENCGLDARAPTTTSR